MRGGYPKEKVNIRISGSNTKFPGRRDLKEYERGSSSTSRRSVETETNGETREDVAHISLKI